MEQKLETNGSPSMALSSVGFCLLELLCVVGKNSLSGVCKTRDFIQPYSFCSFQVPLKIHGNKKNKNK